MEMKTLSELDLSCERPPDGCVRRTMAVEMLVWSLLAGSDLLEALHEAAGEQACPAGALESAFEPAVFSLLVHKHDVSLLQLDLCFTLRGVRHNHTVPDAQRQKTALSEVNNRRNIHTGLNKMHSISFQIQETDLFLKNILKKSLLHSEVALFD